MRKELILGAVLLALSLGLAAAPAVTSADMINITGKWPGKLTCDTGPLKGKSGAMTANLKQSEEGAVTGTAVVKGLTKDRLDCTLENATIVGERFLWHMQCGRYRLALVTIARGDTISGSFDINDIGGGSLKLDR